MLRGKHHVVSSKNSTSLTVGNEFGEKNRLEFKFVFHPQKVNFNIFFISSFIADSTERSEKHHRDNLNLAQKVPALKEQLTEWVLAGGAAL